MYPSKRGYYSNNGNKEVCYPYSHINSIFINDDESKTLANYNAQNDSNISDIYSTLGEIVGNGIVSGLQVLAQDNPNMTVQVNNGIMRKPDGTKLNINGKNLITVNASDSTRPRKDVIYLEADLSTIDYIAGDYPVAIAGKETYTITTNAEAERAGSNTYTITTNFVPAIAGSNTYSLTTNFINNDTVTINGVTFTAVSSGSTGNQFNIGTDTSISMTNLATALNNNTTINSIYNVVASSNTITITEKVAGNGNTPSNITVTGNGIISNGTFITSKSADTITFNNITFTATSATQDNTHFIVGSDVISTATNFKQSLTSNINITNLYNITSSSNVITITEKMAGNGTTPSNMTYLGTGKLNNGTPIISKPNDTITINGIIFTAVTNNATGDEFNIGADINATANNLITVLNLNTAINSFYNATASNNVITLTEKIAGDGNVPSIAITTGTIKITNGAVTTSKTNMPLAPTIPNGAFLLSEININAGTTVINNSNIIDKRNLITKLESKQNKININNSNEISINHNGNCFPFIRLLYTDKFTGKTYELKRELEYDNKNNVNIYIEEKYVGTNGVLTKVNDNKYYMTYDQGVIMIVFNYMT
jgi:hypothetical protein